MSARIAIAVSAIIALCHAPCSAQVGPLVSKITWRPTKPAPADIKTGPWTTSPIRRVNLASSPFFQSKSLVEIEERMPPEHIYRNVNRPGEWAHETTHGVNSRLRNEIGAGVGVYYVLGNKAWVLKNPSTKLSRVAQLVSPRDRGEVFHTYLVAPSQSQPQTMPGKIVEGWEDEPLYILDEWVAYLAGATVMQELYGSQVSIPIPNQPGHSDSVVDTKRATEFVPYVDALLRAIEADDPNYEDMDKLKQFVGLNMDRLAKLTELHPQPNFQAIQQVFYQRWGNCRSPQPQCIPQPQMRPAQPKSQLPPVPAKPTVAPQDAAQNDQIANIHQSIETIVNVQSQNTDLLMARIEAMAKRIEELESQKPPQDGKDGVSPSIDAIVNQVIKQLELPTPIDPQVVKQIIAAELARSAVDAEVRAPSGAVIGDLRARIQYPIDPKTANAKLRLQLVPKPSH